MPKTNEELERIIEASFAADPFWKTPRTRDELIEEITNRTQPNYFPPATTAEVAKVEATIGQPLPEILRRFTSSPTAEPST